MSIPPRLETPQPLNSLPPLIRAVVCDDLVTVKRLIKEGVDVEIADRSGHRALHYAADGRNEILQELLLARADRTVPEPVNGTTALHRAIGRRHKDCVSSLLSEKFVVGKKKKREFLRSFVNQRVGPLEFTHLAMACLSPPDPDILLELLNAGAQVNDCYNRDGVLPIHVASMFANTVVIKALLKFGANVNAPMLQDKQNSLMLLSGVNSDKTSYPSKPPLEELVQMLDFMLQLPELQLDNQNSDGQTALHLASSKNCSKAVNLLLDAGADPTITDHEGNTPVYSTSDPAIRRLLQAYQGERSAHVIGYRSNVSKAPNPLKAVGLTRRKQCLVTSEGAHIEAGLLPCEPSDGASRMEHPAHGINLVIPQNALAGTVSITLNYTPNPAVLRLQSDQHKKGQIVPRNAVEALPEMRVMMSKAVLPYNNATDLMEQGIKPGTRFVAFSLPVHDFSKRAKETVISPFVTITTNSPGALHKEASLTIPHCAKSVEESSKSTKKGRPFDVSVKEQSVATDGSLTGWTTVSQSKVECDDKEVVVRADKLELASTYVAVATSTTERPIKEVMKKRLGFWVFGNAKLEREMDVAVVCCTNAYCPANLVIERLQQGFKEPFERWHLDCRRVLSEKDIKMEMVAMKSGWVFHPNVQVVEQDDIIPSPDAIHPYYFCLLCEDGDLKRICCRCNIHYDETKNPQEMAFLTPKLRKTESDFLPEKTVDTKPELSVEAEKTSQTALDESVSPDLAAKASSRERPSGQGFDDSAKKIPSVKQLWTLSKHLAGRWKHVARSLDVEESTITQVDGDYKGLREQAYQMLLAWKEKLSQSASIEVLCKALRDERLTSVAGKVFDLSDKLIYEL